MPFDSTNFPEKQEDDRHPRISDTAACALILLLAAILLLTPISMAALVDIVRFALGS